MNWFSLQYCHDFGADEVGQQATQPRVVMQAPLPDGLIPASHISNPLSVVGELYLEPSLNAVPFFRPLTTNAKRR
jgi:hypothetical protein